MHHVCRYASAAKTIALSILYAPILPVSPIIGLVGIAFSYAADQWLALRVCQTPKNFDSDALDLAGLTISLLPLAQLLLMYLLYFEGLQGTLAPFCTGIIILGLFKVLPIKAKLNLARRADDEDGGTDNRRCAHQACSLCCNGEVVCDTPCPCIVCSSAALRLRGLTPSA